MVASGSGTSSYAGTRADVPMKPSRRPFTELGYLTRDDRLQTSLPSDQDLRQILEAQKQEIKTLSQRADIIDKKVGAMNAARASQKEKEPNTPSSAAKTAASSLSRASPSKSSTSDASSRPAAKRLAPQREGTGQRLRRGTGGGISSQTEEYRDWLVSSLPKQEATSEASRLGAPPSRPVRPQRQLAVPPHQGGAPDKQTSCGTAASSSAPEALQSCDPRQPAGTSSEAQTQPLAEGHAHSSSEAVVLTVHALRPDSDEKHCGDGSQLSQSTASERVKPAPTPNRLVQRAKVLPVQPEPLQQPEQSHPSNCTSKRSKTEPTTAAAHMHRRKSAPEHVPNWARHIPPHQEEQADKSKPQPAAATPVLAWLERQAQHENPKHLRLPEGSLASRCGTEKQARARTVSPDAVRQEGEIKYRILCYGDSLTAGFCSKGRHFEPYGPFMSKALRNAGVGNDVSVCGLSGLTAQDMLGQLTSPSVEDVAGNTGTGLAHILNEGGHRDLVLLMAGTNDLAVEKPDSKVVFQRVKSLHEVCHSKGVKTVVLAPPGPMPPAHRAARLQLKSMLANLARNTPGIVGFADCEELVPRSAQSNARKLWDPDDIHMTAEGSRTLGQKLVAVVLDALLGQGSARQGAAAKGSNTTPARLSRPGCSFNMEATLAGLSSVGSFYGRDQMQAAAVSNTASVPVHTGHGEARCRSRCRSVDSASFVAAPINCSSATAACVLSAPEASVPAFASFIPSVEANPSSCRSQFRSTLEGGRSDCQSRCRSVRETETTQPTVATTVVPADARSMEPHRRRMVGSASVAQMSSFLPLPDNPGGSCSLSHPSFVPVAESVTTVRACSQLRQAAPNCTRSSVALPVAFGTSDHSFSMLDSSTLSAVSAQSTSLLAGRPLGAPSRGCMTTVNQVPLSKHPTIQQRPNRICSARTRSVSCRRSRAMPATTR